MFNKAIEWGNAKENPIKKIKLFKENNERVRFLEKEEIGRLLEVCDHYLKQIVITALNTGMRKGELFNLKWSDVDFRNNLIFVNKTKNKERRIIPMNTALRKTLINMREHSTSESVFPNKGIRNRFEKALRCAIIKNFRFHDLRHTFASHLIMSGIDLMTVRELLGHKSIKMTMRYAHLSQDHKTRAMEIFGQAMDTIWTPKAQSRISEKFEFYQPVENEVVV